MTSDGLVHPTTSTNGMHIHEWNAVIQAFNKNGYQVTDATDKEFVGIRIEVYEHSNYYMNQHCMIDPIMKEANITGAKDEHLPYPTDVQQLPLSKIDCPTNDVDRITCQKDVSSDNSYTV